MESIETLFEVRPYQIKRVLECGDDYAVVDLVDCVEADKLGVNVVTVYPSTVVVFSDESVGDSSINPYDHYIVEGYILWGSFDEDDATFVVDVANLTQVKHYGFFRDFEGLTHAGVTKFVDVFGRVYGVGFEEGRTVLNCSVELFEEFDKETAVREVYHLADEGRSLSGLAFDLMRRRFDESFLKLTALKPSTNTPN